MSTQPETKTPDEVRAFHPKTLGVMYPAEIVSESSKTAVVRFPTITGKRRYVVAKRHIAVNGVFLAN